jgi:hypothetical protein
MAITPIEIPSTSTPEREREGKDFDYDNDGGEGRREEPPLEKPLNQKIKELTEGYLADFKDLSPELKNQLIDYNCNSD